MRARTSYTQTSRLLGLETVLGPDELLVRGLSGHEEISRVFRFKLELISENNAIDLDALIGTQSTLRLALADGSSKYWNGHISRITQGQRGAIFTSYQAELVPWLWFLDLNRNSRIFQNKQTPDVVRDVFTLSGFKDFEFRLEGEFPKREYCVQYRETDLTFVMRLLEEEGILFFFEHTKDRHKLILADRPVAHPVCANQPSARWRNTMDGRMNEDFVTEWQYAKTHVSSGAALTDFNFRTPARNLNTHLNGDGPFEVYEQPGIYEEKGRGQALTRIRLEEIQTPETVVRGESNCRAFAAGFRFKLREHYRKEWNHWYLLTQVRHEATLAGNFMGDEQASDAAPAYHNEFICMPYDIPFRPARRTPVPAIKGCQTAIVVGPKNEEIYTDEFGRIKVQFHWDREGKRDENSSCWIRVAQSWAGRGWGAITIPRVGQEVVVEFLEGNPDRPLVTGCVYNGQMTPPYPLPANKSTSGVKSNTTKGGGGYNEIALRDTKGDELIRIHGQKDMDTTVNHDERVRIGHDRTERVGHNETVTVSLLRTHNVGLNDMLNVGAAQETSIGGAQAITVCLDRSVTVGLSQQTDVGRTFTLDAGDTIVLRTGSSSITLQNDGTIIIEGKNIAIRGSDTIVAEAERIDLN